MNVPSKETKGFDRYLSPLDTWAIALGCMVGWGAFVMPGTKGVDPGFAMLSLVILAPWAFVGFEIISFETVHFKFPVSKAKGILVTSILAAAFIYIGMTVVSITISPDGYANWAEYISDLGNLSGVESVPTFFAAKAALGDAGLAIVAVTALAAIPILALTANAFKEDAQAAMDAGMQAHIAKPIDVNVMMRELGSVL